MKSIALDGEEIPEYTRYISSIVPSLSKTQRKWAKEVAAAAVAAAT